jgi:hypothetical protein
MWDDDGAITRNRLHVRVEAISPDDVIGLDEVVSRQYSKCEYKIW